MKNNSLYENLDTAFVDLDALVRYLRRRKFMGDLHLAFTGYEAVITFTAEGKLRVLEHDKIAAVRTDGEKAFLNMIARAKEPGGIVNVSQVVAADEKKPAAVKGLSSGNAPEVTRFPSAANGNGNGMLLDHVNIAQIDERPEHKRPEFPFALANDVEEKARLVRHPGADHDTLVMLTSEILKSVDQALEKAELNFSEAFAKACSEISGEFPFMDPVKGDFVYSGGKIDASVQHDPKLLIEGVGEALSRIFGRLNSVPRLGKVYRFASQRVRALNHERQDLYDRYMITPMLNQVLRA